jgi:hypothetical protein
VELTPSLDLGKLFALTTEVPANIQVAVRWNQTLVAQDTRQVSVLGRWPRTIIEIILLSRLARREASAHERSRAAHSSINH